MVTAASAGCVVVVVDGVVVVATVGFVVVVVVVGFVVGEVVVVLGVDADLLLVDEACEVGVEDVLVRLKLADGNDPFQTLCVEEFSMSVAVAPDPTILTAADPLPSALKLIDATVCVPLRVDVDAHETPTEPPPPLLSVQIENAPVELLKYCNFDELYERLAVTPSVLSDPLEVSDTTTENVLPTAWLPLDGDRLK